MNPGSNRVGGRVSPPASHTTVHAGPRAAVTSRANSNRPLGLVVEADEFLHPTRSDNHTGRVAYLGDMPFSSRLLFFIGNAPKLCTNNTASTRLGKVPALRAKRSIYENDSADGQ